MHEKRSNIVPVRLTDSELAHLKRLSASYSVDDPSATNSFVLRHGIACLPFLSDISPSA